MPLRCLGASMVDGPANGRLRTIVDIRQTASSTSRRQAAEREQRLAISVGVAACHNCPAKSTWRSRPSNHL